MTTQNDVLTQNVQYDMQLYIDNAQSEEELIEDLIVNFNISEDEVYKIIDKKFYQNQN